MTLATRASAVTLPVRASSRHTPTGYASSCVTTKYTPLPSYSMTWTPFDAPTLGTATVNVFCVAVEAFTMWNVAPSLEEAPVVA